MFYEQELRLLDLNVLLRISCAFLDKGFLYPVKPEKVLKFIIRSSQETMQWQSEDPAFPMGPQIHHGIVIFVACS